MAHLARELTGIARVRSDKHQTTRSVSKLEGVRTSPQFGTFEGVRTSCNNRHTNASQVTQENIPQAVVALVGLPVNPRLLLHWREGSPRVPNEHQSVRAAVAAAVAFQSAETITAASPQQIETCGGGQSATISECSRVGSVATVRAAMDGSFEPVPRLSHPARIPQQDRSHRLTASLPETVRHVQQSSLATR
jgi:hypothetical protein